MDSITPLHPKAHIHKPGAPFVTNTVDGDLVVVVECACDEYVYSVSLLSQP